MSNQTKLGFGNLTKKAKYDIKRVLNKDTMHIDYLFENSIGRLEQLSVIQAERQMAVENLRTLTKELQTKRLRYKAKNSCKYFTL